MNEFNLAAIWQHGDAVSTSQVAPLPLPSAIVTKSPGCITLAFGPKAASTCTAGLPNSRKNRSPIGASAACVAMSGGCPMLSLRDCVTLNVRCDGKSLMVVSPLISPVPPTDSITS